MQLISSGSYCYPSVGSKWKRTVLGGVNSNPVCMYFVIKAGLSSTCLDEVGVISSCSNHVSLDHLPEQYMYTYFTELMTFHAGLLGYSSVYNDFRDGIFWV